MVYFRERQNVVAEQVVKERNSCLTPSMDIHSTFVNYAVARSTYLQKTMGNKVSRIIHPWMTIQLERQ